MRSAPFRRCAARGWSARSRSCGPGESFEYTSWCVIATPTGTMQGSYQMVTRDGERFDAEIAPFALTQPQLLN